MPDGWDNLLNIYRGASEQMQERDAQPPITCPHDGEPLLDEPDTGRPHCQFCGWCWDGLPIRYR